MKNRPKRCVKTIALLCGIAGVLLTASAVVGEVVVSRLVDAVRAEPEIAAPPPTPEPR